jgi:hypothetical protein
VIIRFRRPSGERGGIGGRCGDGSTGCGPARQPPALDQRDVEAAVTNIGFWGLHLTESNRTQGNLIRLVRRQIASVS